VTGFDITVLILVGVGAVLGFMRGFVHEVLALLAWVLAVAAIHLLHPTLSAALLPYVHTTSGAWVLAFAILWLVPYVGTRLVAKWLGSASRNSVIGPIDRVLGFGFGAVKGTVIVVLAFAVVTLGYDIAWGKDGRPTWITDSRTYPFINACSEKLLKVLSERRAEATAGDSGDDAGDSATDDAKPAPKKHHKHAAE